MRGRDLRRRRFAEEYRHQERRGLGSEDGDCTAKDGRKVVENG